jgi:uncharacterized membrane protein YwaF
VQVNLPLQLSDAVTLVSVAALWHPEYVLLVELLVFGERRVPRPGALWRAYAITAAVAAVAAMATVLTGGNSMFLGRKPAGGSLLDVMGPWPVYIVMARRPG